MASSLCRRVHALDKGEARSWAKNSTWMAYLKRIILISPHYKGNVNRLALQQSKDKYHNLLANIGGDWKQTPMWIAEVIQSNHYEMQLWVHIEILFTFMTFIGSTGIMLKGHSIPLECLAGAYMYISYTQHPKCLIFVVEQVKSSMNIWMTFYVKPS